MKSIVDIWLRVSCHTTVAVTHPILVLMYVKDVPIQNMMVKRAN